MANQVQDKSKLFVENWAPSEDEQKPVRVSFWLPFVVLVASYVLSIFAGIFGGVLTTAGWLFAIVYIGGSLVSKVHPIPWFEAYGWLQFDDKFNAGKYTISSADYDEKFINALINVGLIDGKTRTDEVEYECLKNDGTVLVYYLKLSQAGKPLDSVGRAVANSAPALNAFGVQTKRVGNTSYEIMYSFVDPLKAYNKTYKQSDEYEPGAPYKVAVHEPDGQIISIKSNESLRAVITGSSGSGKSVCMQALLCEIAKSGPEHQVVIFDPKIVCFTDFSDRFEVINDSSNFDVGIKAIFDEMMRRYELMDAEGTQEWIVSEDRPLLYVFIDEIAEFFDSASDKKTKDARKEYVKRIITMGRQCGIGLSIAGQTIDANTVDSVIRNNLDYRCVLRTFNAQQAKFVVPEGMEDECPSHQLPTEVKGIGYFMTPSTDNHFLMGRVYWVSQDDIKRVVARYSSNKRPLRWLHEALNTSQETPDNSDTLGEHQKPSRRRKTERPEI